MLRQLLPTLFLLSTLAVAEARKPNFIFVLSDDIAQGDLGVYGQELIQTPRLDQIAAEGTRYLQAYCGTTVCAPSRSSFFTGLHTGHCPVRGNYELPPEGQLPLPEKTVTIAEVAKAADYATATFGKWGMGFFDTTGAPAKQGVDHFFGYNCQRHAHSYFPTYLYNNDQPFILPGNDGRTVGKTYSQELIQNDMLKWVRGNFAKPFMMFYAITLPHGRHEIDDFGIYNDKPWSKEQKSYAAQVTRIDSDMGELVDTLRELGIAEDTLIVFSGDNGSSFDPKSEIGKRFNQASNGLRGYKRGMYEGALRQAAFAWWPGTVPAGRVDSQPWAFWDLLPTFTELSGATPPAGYETDGKSLVAYLKGGDAPQRDYFYWELHEGPPQQAARFGQWKAVRQAPNKPIEIYNLTDDPGELKNIASEHPEHIKRAEEIFTDAHRPDPNWPLDGNNPEAKAKAAEAWKIKNQRDKDTWIPESAIPLAAFPGKKSVWNNYTRYDFQTDGQACIVIEPKEAAKGKPWVWRARFFGHEPQADLALLAKGYHIAYCEVGGLFGSPKAVAHWNAFHAYLTNEHNFAKKVALEGMSRGGLIIYNWAADNPDKVACIYGDAPVCDISSWPGGKGSGKGSPNDWKAALAVYGITEDQIAAFKGNPIDRLEPIAKAGIPILHVVGAADDVVPVSENTAIIEQRYKALGGSIEIISKPGGGHHPHALKDPQPIVDFILKHTAS